MGKINGISERIGAGERIGESDKVLATINFVRATVKNGGESRYCYRARYLVPWVLKHERRCSDCQRVMLVGEQGALVEMSVIYCSRCVAWMDEKDAYQTAPEKACEPAEAARLRGEKYGLVSVREFKHEVSVAEGRA
ncbi:hypothetical protein CCP3SC15_450021 [Gammaproteobacteria bacterium]